MCRYVLTLPYLSLYKPLDIALLVSCPSSSAGHSAARKFLSRAIPHSLKYILLFHNASPCQIPRKTPDPHPFISLQPPPPLSHSSRSQYLLILILSILSVLPNRCALTPQNRVTKSRLLSLIVLGNSSPNSAPPPSRSTCTTEKTSAC
jgi:hypothetical protein